MSDHHELLGRLREICLALPEMSERISHGAPTFFVREKKVVCSFHPDGIHGEHGMSLWAPAPPGVQEQLVDDEPERFYRPPYVGGRGWIGLRLDRDVDWDEIEGIVRDSYRHVAPKSLARRLDVN
ncbi:MAG: MmcQ/YjbR family DNA-binding protein [Ilumatobacter sp.]|nr:MmcQ/YjbR family DNA-binding protein [Ilumatobacter sp.]